MTVLCDALTVEREALCALWTETFGDPPALVGRFLALLPELGFGLAAIEDGKLLGAAYWIDALRLEDKRCGYLYAVAVTPAARSCGIGAALSRACIEQGRARGAAWCCTEPAEPSLFDWYARLGLRPALYRRRRKAAALLPVTPLSAEDDGARREAELAAPLPVSRLRAAEYGQRREALLADRPHVTLLPAALAFEEALLQAYGGGFFAVGEGIAAVERDDSRAVVLEALGADPAALAAALGCARGEVWESADAGELYLAADHPFPSGMVWNLSFD